MVFGYEELAFDSVTIVSESVCRVICFVPGIKIYSLPDVDSDEDEEYKLQVRIKPNPGFIPLSRWPNLGRASPLQFVEQTQWWRWPGKKCGAGNNPIYFSSKDS